MIHQIKDRLRFVVEAGHRRSDDRAHLRQRHHVSQMAEMEGRLPHHQNQSPTFLQCHVGRANNQVGTDAGAMEDIVLMEQGATTMALVWKDPLASLLPMSSRE